MYQEIINLKILLAVVGLGTSTAKALGKVLATWVSTTKDHHNRL
jgi:hypothetical protein